eukprot:3383955-Prymnesium_polylepis.1
MSNFCCAPAWQLLIAELDGHTGRIGKLRELIDLRLLVCCPCFAFSGRQGSEGRERKGGAGCGDDGNGDGGRIGNCCRHRRVAAE